MAENVEVYDIDTKSIRLVPQENLGPEMVRIELNGRIMWTDGNKLKPNDYQHDPFEGVRKERVMFIMRSLAEVYPQTYDEWEDGFRRDQDPDNEISIWEYIINIYEKHSHFVESPQKKKEIFYVTARCSTSEAIKVLNQVDLSVLPIKEAKDIISDYYEK